MTDYRNRGLFYPTANNKKNVNKTNLSLFCNTNILFIEKKNSLYIEILTKGNHILLNAYSYDLNVPHRIRFYIINCCPSGHSMMHPGHVHMHATQMGPRGSHHGNPFFPAFCLDQRVS